MSEESQQQTLGGMIDGMPWWVKAALVVYNTAGLPTLLLVYYLLQDSGVIPNPVDKRLAVIEGQQQETAGAIVQGNATNKEIIKALKEQNQQRQMRCVIKAKTDDEKKSCFPNTKGED